MEAKESIFGFHNWPHRTFMSLETRKKSGGPLPQQRPPPLAEAPLPQLLCALAGSLSTCSLGAWGWGLARDLTRPLPAPPSWSELSPVRMASGREPRRGRGSPARSPSLFAAGQCVLHLIESPTENMLRERSRAHMYDSIYIKCAEAANS